MLEPITSLAFSMHSAKGVYAVLVGSGISRSAKIPTGWEITLDLVRKIAAMRGEPSVTQDAAEAWYVENFSKAPDYAELLDMLAKTPDERHRVLKAYIEPTEEEHGRGDKVPTQAHKALARLIAGGYVKVVITTNFDQLLETALREIGVSPTVITSAESAAGAVPLVHNDCTIVKIHGDYMDTRIRNTPAELAAYEPEVDKLLDRVFDEFGLIICGWSADWDEALKRAIQRAPARRYSMYWSYRGRLSAEALALIEHRRALKIEIKGADDFFGELAEKVTALEAFDAPHPLSADLAVAMLKGYLARDEDHIRLHDLIDRELARLLDVLDGNGFEAAQSSDEIFRVQFKRYETASSTLVAMAFAAGQWASGSQVLQWIEVIQVLSSRGAASQSGYTDLIELRRLPATLVLYAYGLGAICGNKVDELGALVRFPTEEGNQEPVAIADRLASGCVLSHEQWVQRLEGYDKRKVPLSDRIAAYLAPVTKSRLRTETGFERAFSILELVLGFGYAERSGRPDNEHPWAPVGRAGYLAGTTWKLVEAWEKDPALLSRMAGLTSAPRFALIKEMVNRHRF